MDSFALLFQWINLEDFLTIDRQSPVRFQLLAANFNPCLHKTSLVVRELTCKELSICDAEGRLVLPILRVDMRNVMLFVVRIVHADDNSIENREDWHNSISSFDYIFTHGSVAQSLIPFLNPNHYV